MGNVPDFLKKTSDKQSMEYREILRRINPRKVLEYYGAENATEVDMGAHGVEVQHSCLIDRVDRHHSHGDQNPSACMNLDKKAYICYSYGGGDVLWLIKTMEQADDLASIMHIVGRFLEDAVSGGDDFLKELDGIFNAGPATEEDAIPRYSERVLRKWSVCHPYMVNQRGVSVDALSRLQIGYDEHDRRITFPHFHEGKLVGWQKRSVPDGLGYPPTLPDEKGRLAKYKNTVNFPKSTTIYNYDRVVERGVDTVIVVESPMSVAIAETFTTGDDILAGVVATFGAKISQKQIDMLKRFNHVLVYMDSDSAGFNAEKKLTRGLWKFCDTWVVRPEPGLDMGDYRDRDSILRVLSNGVPAFAKIAEWDSWRRENHG